VIARLDPEFLSYFLRCAPHLADPAARYAACYRDCRGTSATFIAIIVAMAACCGGCACSGGSASKQCKRAITVGLELRSRQHAMPRTTPVSCRGRHFKRVRARFSGHADVDAVPWRSWCLLFWFLRPRPRRFARDSGAACCCHWDPLTL